MTPNWLSGNAKENLALTIADRIVMYEQQFGLKKRPFRARAAGTDVFIGPEIAVTMQALKAGLTANDAIVTVSGPVGSGKTTLVHRALASIDENPKIVVVGRMRLGSGDLLELLLDQLGVKEIPASTIRKIALFRHHLKGLAANNTRVFITIEDAVRLGTDTLAEVEALTAGDAGDSEGASIVLMGDDRLKAMLGDASLARIQQRIRKRLKLAGLSAVEMHNYFKHCFKLAGGDFGQVFEAGAAELLHHLSDGTPRVANNLAESAMRVAASKKLGKVPTSLLTKVAEGDFGMSVSGFDASPGKSEPGPQAAKAESAAPELIQDTQPELGVLTPESAAASNSAGQDTPAWDRDSTLAELRPDFDALELAMASTKSDEPAPAADSRPVTQPEPEVPQSIPEITLDHAISQRIDDNLVDEPGEVSPPAPVETQQKPSTKESPKESPKADKPPKPDKKSEAEMAEMAEIAAGLANAKSIEDVDDKLAETLFGNEINFVAAQILANPPPVEPEENQPAAESDPKPQAVATEKPLAVPATPVAVTEKSGQGISPTLDDSPSERLRTVMALNARLSPAADKQPAVAKAQPAPAPVSPPEPIENQINTSITQTRKTLELESAAVTSNEDESPSGFFGRFKRS